jgi:6-pyruvoyltetrahydropterin/6-carboxytetrahydropterin synthase
VSHAIRLGGGTLRFSAAHFTTFGGECEPLHGHNYAVTVEIVGDLTSDAWVMDFSEAKRIVASVCKELDHKFILQSDSSTLAIDTGIEVEVNFGSRRYVMPVGDVAALPIDNSTAERLAEWLSERLVEELAAAGTSNLESILVGVEEAPGQSGWFRLALSERTGARRES